ncbi:Clathrin Heavy Chain 1 [Manis pentadactyla]|nr:Clathrin Heavy Chain 1 [Manis pentadactyla]
MAASRRGRESAAGGAGAHEGSLAPFPLDTQRAPVVLHLLQLGALGGPANPPPTPADPLVSFALPPQGLPQSNAALGPGRGFSGLDLECAAWA